MNEVTLDKEEPRPDTIYINRDELDQKCARYSTYGFLCGICIIVLCGISLR